MDLFKPIVKESDLHPHFQAVSIEGRKAEREELMKWAEGFVDRDGKFIDEFQRTFNSSFWEIYLYAVCKEYQLEIDWNYRTPDFIVNSSCGQFIIEATTANAAFGKPNEWDKLFTPKELDSISWIKFNTEAMIRLSNAFSTKFRYYKDKYTLLPHVQGKPFVLAIAPFEQPHFNLQHNRAIVALLYDIYVDEDAYAASPELYPEGVPERQLGSVEKENRSEVELGIFNDDRCSEISAVIFSCTATWGKVSALANNTLIVKKITWSWASEPYGAPVVYTNNHHSECLTDGLMIFHNPYAKYPLSPEIFRRTGVVQYIPNRNTREMTIEESTRCLLTRLVQNFHFV